MSWTRVASAANYSVKNPIHLTEHSLSALNSRFSFPDKQTSIATSQPITYIASITTSLVIHWVQATY
jgi:hypothetical protein